GWHLLSVRMVVVSRVRHVLPSLHSHVPICTSRPPAICVDALLLAVSALLDRGCQQGVDHDIVPWRRRLWGGESAGSAKGRLHFARGGRGPRHSHTSERDSCAYGGLRGGSDA